MRAAHLLRPVDREHPEAAWTCVRCDKRWERLPRKRAERFGCVAVKLAPQLARLADVVPFRRPQR